MFKEIEKVNGMESYKLSKLEISKIFCRSAGVEPQAGSLSLMLGRWYHPKCLTEHKFADL